MTSLSFIIYAADVLNSLKIVMIFCSVAMALLFLGQIFAFAIAESRYTPRYMRTLVVLCLGFGVTSAFFPQRSTMLMIAATEAGTQVAQTEAAQGLLSDSVALLRKKLRESLNDEGKDSATLNSEPSKNSKN